MVHLLVILISVIQGSAFAFAGFCTYKLYRLNHPKKLILPRNPNYPYYPQLLRDPKSQEWVRYWRKQDGLLTREVGVK